MTLRIVPRASILLFVAGIAVGAFSLTFTHLAGSAGGPGFDDGTGNDARFNAPSGVASDGTNVFVADSGNHTIRRISAAGVVTTLAGFAEAAGASDGRGGNARFRGPAGVAVDAAGYVYVADKGNHTIRQIAPDREVTTIAGSAGQSGFAGGTTTARFNSPSGITLDPATGTIYVADTGNHSIRMIVSGFVTTIAGTGSAGNANGYGTAASFESPTAVVFDGASNSLFVADSGNAVVRRINLVDGEVTTFAGTMDDRNHMNGAPGKFFSPYGLALAPGSALYVSDSADHSLRYVTSGGSVSDVAGAPTYPGPEDGSGYGARFRVPRGIALSGSTLFVADSGNHTVRSVDTASGNAVSTPAGLANASGFVNATGSAARFDGPSAVFHYPGPGYGYSYVSDTNNHAVRRVSWDGVVTTFAGGTWGYLEGTGTAARFKFPAGLAGNWDGTAYVADTGNHCIRFVSALGVTSLFAGQPQSSGYLDGDRLTTAKFSSPKTLALNTYPTLELYVHDAGNHRIRKIDLATGTVSTLMYDWGYLDLTTGTLGLSASMGDLYLAGNGVVVKRSSDGTLTNVAGSVDSGPLDGIGTAARFAYPGPRSISVVGSTAYVLDALANLIRTVDLTSRQVTTIAGGATTPLFPYDSGWVHHPNSGTAGGTGRFSRFNDPTALGGGWSELAVLEGHTLRLARGDLADRATIDKSLGNVGQTRQLDAQPVNANSWEWSLIRRPTGSVANLSSTAIRNPTFTPDVADFYVFRCVARNSTTHALSISTIVLEALPAPTHTWANAAGGSWSTASNWSGGVSPAGGDEHLLFPLLVPESVTTTNDQSGLSVANLSVAGVYTLNGNALTVTDDVVFEEGGVVNMPLSGSASLRKTGSGFLVLNDATLSGPMTFSVGGAALNGAGTSVGDVLVDGGALQIVCGSAGMLQITAGEAWPYPCGVTLRGLAVSTPGTLRISLDGGAGPGVIVNGGVTLGGYVTFNGTTTENRTLIQNDGSDPVVGTFFGLPQGSTVTIGGKPFRISYTGGDGNDVTLTALPYITSLSKSAGPAAGGQTLVINGGVLSGATDVTLGGSAATITGNTATSVTVTTPPHAAGTVGLRVDTTVGFATLSSAYTFVDAPAITSIVPSGGPTAGGQSVTINGTNLSSASVSIGGAPVTPITNTSTTISFTTPAHAAGTVPVTVTTDGGVATVLSGYTYMPPFGAPPGFVATAVSASQVDLSWIPVEGATSYEIHRRVDTSGFTLRTTTTAAAFSDTGLTATTAYLYRVRAVGPAGPSAFSTPDLATTILLSDDPLGTAPVRAAHMTQLRSAVNAIRAVAGLAAFSFTETPATGTPIRAQQVSQLRTALEQGRITLGLGGMFWTDAVLTPGSTTVKAVHMEQLRAGVK